MNIASRHPTQSVIILCLTGFASGAMDVFSYSQLGHVFASAMTGNIALITYSLLNKKPIMLLLACAGVGAFCFGVVLGAALPRIRPLTRLHVSLPGTEALLLAAFAICAQAGTQTSAIRVLLIALGACAMGLQIVIAIKIGLPAIPSVVFTTTLASAVLGLTVGRPLSADTKHQWLVLGVYAAGGLISAGACVTHPGIAAFLPGIAILPAVLLWAGAANTRG